MTVLLPSSVAGDFLVVGLGIFSGGGPATPSPWTLRQVPSQTNTQLVVYTATSTGPGMTLTVTGVGQTLWRAIAINVGAKSYDNSTQHIAGVTSTTATTNSLTAIGATAVLLDFYLSDVSAVSITPLTPTVLTNAWEGADFLTVPAGATGTHSATLSSAALWVTASVVCH